MSRVDPQKMGFGSGIFQVESGQNFLTRIAMSICEFLDPLKHNWINLVN